MRVVLAPPGLAEVLEQELGARVTRRLDDLFVIDDDQPVAWAQNIWSEAQYFKFDSISQAAAHLRSIQRNWWLHSTQHHRRANLIQGALPKIKPKPIAYFSPPPAAPLGSWTLLEPGLLLQSKSCASPFPDGTVSFLENKTEPPSRAYLKLWEFFTLTQNRPQVGEQVLDLGSSPGGWTWVLDQTGCNTLSVDKAPFADTFRPSARVEYRAQSAFALTPAETGPVDWLFSDIICYPERLLEMVYRWLDHARNLVCTIKFQGETDFKTIERFRAIAGSEIRHLSCNKHELTWSLLRKS